MTDEQIKNLLANDQFVSELSGRVLEKADTINQATNLLWYDLSPVVQLLYPFKELIPLISKLPRVPGDGGNAYHWKRITAINVNSLDVGVSEGNRGGVIALDLQDQIASYKSIGYESSVTFEARLGAKNLTPDAIGNAVQATLRSVLIAEEKTLLLANSTNALGTTPTPTVTDAGVVAGASLPATTSVICVALTGKGWLSASVTNGIKQQITRINADGSQDTIKGYAAAPSANGTQSITSGHGASASITAVLGAMAYAWFWGTAGAEKLGAITSQATVSFSVAATGTQTAASLLSTDCSQDALVPDGIFAMIFGEIFGPAPLTVTGSTNPNLPAGVTITKSGSLLMTLANGSGGALTASGVSINQFDAMLKAAYEQYKLGYDKILVNVQQVMDIAALLLASGSNATLYRIVTEQDANGKIVAGRRITSYLNKFMGNTLDIEVHPFVPPGVIMFWSEKVPYDLPGVPNILEAHVRQDYYEIQWPLRSRRYEYGVYADEVFSCYFPPAFGAIANVYSTN